MRPVHRDRIRGFEVAHVPLELLYRHEGRSPLCLLIVWRPWGHGQSRKRRACSPLTKQTLVGRESPALRALDLAYQNQPCRAPTAPAALRTQRRSAEGTRDPGPSVPVSGMSITVGSSQGQLNARMTFSGSTGRAGGGGEVSASARRPAAAFELLQSRPASGLR